ncbi:MAG: endonuclease MutS2, partial [Chloroflexi bacterium]|nr:endonuclease MutS2 [Chloroflexota bacterium]
PSSDYRGVGRRQRLTAEARKLAEMKPNLSLGAARDVRELVRQAALGHVLQPGELLDVEATLSLARSVRDTVNRLRVHLPLLAETCEAIEDFAPLIAEINRCVNQRAEIIDRASPVLAELRRQARHAHDRLTGQLQRLINSQAGRAAVQEPIITLRDGRYVIPVKAEMRGQIRGIVHDVSSSGATVFMEPLEAVELGNEWRELQLEEQREVERILRALSASVGEAADEIAAAVDALAEVDLALAKAKLGDALGARDLPVEGPEQPWLTEPPAQLRLVNARHPLLTGDVVPITVWVGRPSPLPRGRGKGEGAFTALLITGPNTGGKTVALKTVGLLALMAQAGLAVPAEEGTRLPVFEGVHADIGDEQSIEQSLSTFSSHMGNIIGILREVTPNSLVLLDELGAGTDPTEGSALAKAVLQHLLRTGCLTLATTHHGELKAFAHETPGIANASVEFDPETLAPTYHLSIGLPGQSNALAIAQRLGLPEPILDEAKRSVAPEHLKVESLIVDLQRQRQAARAERKAETAARAGAEAAQRELEKRLASLDAERQRTVEQARRQMEREVERARKRLQDAVRALEKAAAAPSQRRLKALETARKLIRQVEEQVQKLEQRRKRPRGPLPPIGPGDRVWVRGVPQPGEALSAPDAEGAVEVKLGSLRAKVKLSDVEAAEKAKLETRDSAPPPRVSSFESRVSPEVHVRGMTIDEALALIDQRLDEAFRQGAGTLRIVHGKGTGTLRRAVREALSKHPLVRSHAPASPREGGDGVTVVELTN